MYKEVENEAGTNSKPENKPVLGDVSTIFQRKCRDGLNQAWEMTEDQSSGKVFSYKASEGSIEKNLVISPYAKVDEMAGIPK